MPRIKLSEQDGYDFIYKTTVRIGHVNKGGHLGHDALVGIIWEARMDLYDSLGLHELDLGDGRTGVIMQDLVVNYQWEAFRREELTIESRAGEIKGRTFRMFHRVTSGDKRIALVETGFVAFDYATRKSVPVPREFVEALERHKAGPGKTEERA